MISWLGSCIGRKSVNTIQSRFDCCAIFEFWVGNGCGVVDGGWTTHIDGALFAWFFAVIPQVIIRLLLLVVLRMTLIAANTRSIG